MGTVRGQHLSPALTRSLTQILVIEMPPNSVPRIMSRNLEMEPAWQLFGD